MDPLTAALNFGAALLTYATEVRRDMDPELKKKLDGWVIEDLGKLREAIQKLAGS
jgi:hypothetical protein